MFSAMPIVKGDASKRKFDSVLGGLMRVTLILSARDVVVGNTLRLIFYLSAPLLMILVGMSLFLSLLKNILYLRCLLMKTFFFGCGCCLVSLFAICFFFCLGILAVSVGCQGEVACSFLVLALCTFSALLN